METELLVLFEDEVEQVAWIAPLADFSPEEIDAILPRHGYVARGFKVHYDGSDLDRTIMGRLGGFRWRGYPSRGVAYYIPS